MRQHRQQLQQQQRVDVISALIMRGGIGRIIISSSNKMLSYRRETALQGAL